MTRRRAGTVQGLDQDQRLEELALELEGPDRPGETYLESVNRIREAWSTAREMLAEETAELGPTSATAAHPAESTPGNRPA